MRHTYIVTPNFLLISYSQPRTLSCSSSPAIIQLASLFFDIPTTPSSQHPSCPSSTTICALSTSCNGLRHTSAAPPFPPACKLVPYSTEATLTAANLFKCGGKLLAVGSRSTIESPMVKRVCTDRPNTRVSSSTTPTAADTPVASLM